MPYHEEVKVREAELHVVALAERAAGGERPVLGELALHVDDDVLVDKVRLWRNTADSYYNSIRLLWQRLADLHFYVVKVSKYLCFLQNTRKTRSSIS